MSNYFHSKSQKNRKSMISLGGEKKLFLNLIYSANFLKLKNIGGGGCWIWVFRNTFPGNQRH